jgi:hypothetical protein
MGIKRSNLKKVCKGDVRYVKSNERLNEKNLNKWNVNNYCILLVILYNKKLFEIQIFQLSKVLKSGKLFNLYFFFFANT